MRSVSWTRLGAGLLVASVSALAEAQAAQPEAQAAQPEAQSAQPANNDPATIASPTATPSTAVETGAGSSEAPSSYEIARPSPRPGSLADYGRRQTGMLEAGVGWLVLPGAELCGQRGEEPTCRRGDSSLSLEAWQLFRLSRPFALGAGANMALLPTTDASRPEPDGIERDHTRAYLTVEAAARWYPWIRESFEGWVGIASGLAVVSDRYAVVSEEAKPLIGPAGVTIRSEGFSLGVGGGAAFQLAPGWSVGGALRVGSWFLPSRPARSALGDEASLTGQISTVVVAVNLAYRLRL